MTTPRSQQFPDLVHAIRNRNTRNIAAWAAAYGIDYKFNFVTSDLLTESILLDATILNVALLLRNETVALWAIKSGASLNIPMWRVTNVEQMRSAVSERQQHPLMVALISGLPKVAKAICEKGVDLQYRECFRKGGNDVAFSAGDSIVEQISQSPTLTHFCFENDLEELLSSTHEEPAFELLQAGETQDMFAFERTETIDMFSPEPRRALSRCAP